MMCWAAIMVIGPHAHAPSVSVCVSYVSVGLGQEYVLVVPLPDLAGRARGPPPRRRQPVPDRADDLVELEQDPDALRGDSYVLVGGEMGEHDEWEVYDFAVRLGVVLPEAEAYSAKEMLSLCDLEGFNFAL